MSKANHLADVSQELSQLIRSRKQKVATSEDGDNERSQPPEKTKKLARMLAVRQTEGGEDIPPIMVKILTFGFQPITVLGPFYYIS